MPVLGEGNGPAYISSHSADVILSDIRPIKLKIDALRSINVLLDEFLYNILISSCSLATDKLRASLLALLPTSLGKEALLEAEVELRAYWDRTGPVEAAAHAAEDDTKTFHLQWAFELLRLKCEAYSTLNESDEDAGAEQRINERMAQMRGEPSPSSALVAPAALYLTAILEAMCEHILSNVGRVAARDSSRTSATIDDLFVALCEDDSIYSLFKSMKVYEQIEALSKAPKSRRSKSFSRGDRRSESRTSSPQLEQSLSKPSSISGSRPQQSSEVFTPSTSNSGSRSSFERSRAIKMFKTNSKLSTDREGESQNGDTQHRKTGSFVSEQYDDEMSLQQEEFDDLMRSSATMKVSLTPDRLKTMEVYKQEKDQRGNRRPVPLTFKQDPESTSSRTTTPRIPLRQVDSIVEDDEENTSPKASNKLITRQRQASVANPPTASLLGNIGRARSVSNASGSRSFTRKASLRSAVGPTSYPQSDPAPPIEPPAEPVTATTMMQTQTSRVPKGFDNGGFPQRKRTRARNAESMDLDDVMAGSDEDEAIAPTPLIPPRTSSKSRPPPHAVSSNTKELMDFLAEGPPEPNVSQNGKDLMAFLADGPPSSSPGRNASAASLESKPKAGRLQRMISKLNLGSGEKARGGSPDGFSQPTYSRAPVVPTIRPTLNTQASVNTLSSLANRPIPPRPPRPISPPSSPSLGSHEDENSVTSRARKPSVAESYSVRNNPMPSPHLPNNHIAVSPRKELPEWSAARVPAPSHSNGNAKNDASWEQPKPNSPVYSQPAPIQAKPEALKQVNNNVSRVTPASPVKTPPTRKPVPVVLATPPPPSPPTLSANDLREMHRLFSRATNADECRLIFDMLLSKSGISTEQKHQDDDVPYPSPSPSILTRKHSLRGDADLEHSMIELLLGGDNTPLDNYHSLDTDSSVGHSSASVPEVDQPINRAKSAHDTPAGTGNGVRNRTLLSETKA